MVDDSIVLIDASRLFREGLRRIFSDTSFTVVHEASAIEEALTFIETLQPSLVLVDLPDGGEALSGHMSGMRAGAPGARIVVLTESIRVDRLAEALSLGVDGYLLKNMSAAALHQSLRLVLLGEKVFRTDEPCPRLVGPRNADTRLLARRRPEQADRPSAQDLRRHGQGAPQGDPEEDPRAKPDAGGDLGARARRRSGRLAAPCSRCRSAGRS